MIQEIIKWAWLGIVLSFIISGLLYGLSRGLRKTLFRGAWLVATALLLFFLVSPLVDLILSFDLTSFGIELSINGTVVNNLKDYLTALICDSTGIANTVENATAIADIFQVVKLFINVILFFILFIVFKWILYPLFALLYRLFFRGKAYKQYKKDLKAYKKACKQLKKVNANGFASGSDPEFEETLTPIKENQSYKDIIASIKQRKLEEAQNNTIKTPEDSKISNAQTLSNQTKQENNLESKNVEIQKSTTSTKVEEPEMADNSFVEDKIVELPEEEKKIVDKKSSSLDNLETPIQETKNPEPNNKKKKNEEKSSTIVIEKPVKPTKPKKHRAWGMLAGSVLGIFLCGVMLMPFAGMMDVVNSLNEKPATLIDENNTEDGLITALLKQNADSLNIDLFGEQINVDTIQFFIDNYNNGIGSIFYTYTGAKPLSNLIFNELSSTKIGDVKIYLKEDLVTIVEVASQAISLKNSLNETTSGYTVQNVDSILNQTKNILNSAFSIQLIRGVGDKLIPLLQDIASSYIESLEVSSEDKAFYQDLCSAILTNITSNTNAVDAIKEDIVQVIDAIKNLNAPFENEENKSILTILLNNDFENDKNALLTHIVENKESVTNLFGETLSTRLVSTILPYGVYYLANYLSDLYDFSLGSSVSLEDFKELENIETTLTSIVSEMLNLVETIDYENPSYTSITKNTFICLGKIMDKVSNSLLPDETYSNLINMLKTELGNLLPELNFYGIDLTSAIKNDNGILNSLSEISNWTEEFTKIGTAFDGLLNGENPIITNESIDLVRLGEKLDILATTKLLGGATETSPSKINKLLGDAIISLAENNISTLPNENDRTEAEEALYNIYTYLKDEVATRLTLVNTSNPNISWKNEFTELDSLIKFLSTELAQTEDIFASQNDENSVFVQLGNELDKFIASGKSRLITEEDIYTLLPYGLDYAKGSLTDGMDNEYFVEALSGISTNIKNIKSLDKSINFESEFKYIEKIYKNLGNIDMEDLATTCETLGKLFDEIANTPNHSNLITNNEFVVLVSGILKDFAKDQSNDGIGTAIANLLFSITGKDADNSTTPPTPATTGTLSSDLAGSVLGVFNNENTIITNSTTYELDTKNNLLKINNTPYSLNNKNQVKVENITYEVYKTTPSTYALRIVEHILDSSNPQNIIKYGFWENELKKLISLTEIADIDLSDMDNLSTVGQKLDAVTNDGMLSSKLITNTQLANLMIDVIVDIKGDITDGLTGNTLTIISNMLGEKTDSKNESIVGNLQAIANDEIELNSWETELSFLKDLTDIKDLDNTSLITIGTTLDGIAYNYTTQTNSVLITHPIITNLISDALDIFKPTSSGSNDTTNNAIIKAMNSIQSNIDAIKNDTFETLEDKNFKWQTELNFLDKLTELENLDNLELTEVGATLDSIAYNYGLNNSSFIDHSIITTLIEDVFDTFKPEENNSDKTTAIRNAINSIKTNISSIKSKTFSQLSEINFKWEDELEFLDKLTTLEDLGNAELSSVGATLDSIAYNYEENSTNSKFITHNIIATLIEDVFDTFKPESSGTSDTVNNAIITAMTGMQSNISALKSKPFEELEAKNYKWANELANLSTLKDLSIDSSNYKESGKLTSVGASLDSVAFNNNEKDNSLIITKPIVNALLADILGVAKSGNAEQTSFDNTISQISTKIDGLESNNYYGNASTFKWESELSKLEKLLSVDFEASDMGEVLGNLDFENTGLYYNNQSDLTYNSAPIYGNEKTGAGVKIDEIINNPVSSLNSILIDREIIDELLYNIIDDQSSTLSGDYADIGNNIKNRLNKNHSDYQTIHSYTNELQSINYILDLTKVYSDLSVGLTNEEMALLGSYFDSISNSLLVGDSGANIIIIILDAYNSEDSSSKPEAIDEINSVVKTRANLEKADLIGEIKKNVESVNANYNFETNNYKTLYRSLGEMRTIFSELLNGIEFDFTYEELVAGNSAKQELINMICNISKTLDKLQANEICLGITSKYIAIYTLDMLTTKLNEIHDNSALIPIPYPGGDEDRDYQEALMNYFVTNLTREEVYFNSTWINNENYEIPTDVIIPNSYDSTGIDNSNSEFNYGLIKIVNSYLIEIDNLPSV